MPDAKGSGSQRLEKVRRNMLRMTSPDGFGADSARQEDENEIILTIRIPKCAEKM